MRTHRLVGIVAAVLLAAASPARPAPAPVTEKSPLSWVPASAPGVVHIHGLRTIRDHVVAFLKTTDPAAAKQFQNLADLVLDGAILDRKIRGVPKDGVIFLAFMDLAAPKDGDWLPKKTALIAAVTDYPAFRDNILTKDERKTLEKEGEGVESAKCSLFGPDENLFFVDRKDHVVLTGDKKIAESFTKTPAGLDGKISKAQAERLLQSDAGLYLSMDVFGKDYADQIQAARDALEHAIKDAEDKPEQAMKPLAPLAREAVGPLFQAVDDSQGVLYTLEVHPTGLILHAETEVRAGTKTAAALKDFKPAAFKDLDKLPSGKVFYVGMVTMPALYKLTGTMLFSSLTDPNGDDGKAIDAAVAGMVKAGPRGRVLAVGVPPAGVEVWQFDDPEKAVAAQARLFETTGAALVQSGVLKEKPAVEAKARKYKGFEMTAVRMSWDLRKLAAKTGEGGEKAAGSLKNLLGEELRVWFGTDGKTFLQVTAPDWGDAQKQIDSYLKDESPILDDKAFGEVRQGLPAETTALMVLDATQYAAILAEKAGPLLAAFPGFRAADPTKLTPGRPGYVGVAATLRPERCSLDVFLSAEAVKQLRAGRYWPFW